MPAPRKSRSAYRIYAWGVLFYNIAVILWGAFVRATGSGAGCGEHWPLCNGSAVPQSPTLATVIEFSHRLTSGVAVTLVLGLFVFAWAAFPPRHFVRRAAAAALGFVFMEALIGAAIVLLGHVARNTSTGRGVTLSVHLVNTLMLVAALTLAAWGSGRSGIERRPNLGSLRWLFGIAGLLLLVLGVSGAIAALGDTLFQSTSLRAGWDQDFARGAHPFLRLRIWHPAIAAITGIFLAWVSYAVVLRRVSRQAVRVSYLLALSIAAQLIIGMVNLTLLAPIPLQLIHLLFADVLWIAFVLLGAEVFFSNAEDETPGLYSAQAERLAPVS